MALMSSPPGRIGGVRALLRLLHAAGGELQKSEVVDWMGRIPPSGTEDADKSRLLSVTETIACASSLDFVSTDGNVKLTLNPLPASVSEFADAVHRKLATTESADTQVLNAFAVVVLGYERDDTFLAKSGRDFSAALREALQPDETFNSTILKAWKSWVVGVGLGWELERFAGTFHPAVAERLSRELPAIFSEAGSTTDVSARDFIGLIANRMPYLDGGQTLKRMSKRANLPLPKGRLSKVLSEALRDLADEGRLTLKPIADSPDIQILAPDPTDRRLNDFARVSLPPPKGDA